MASNSRYYYKVEAVYDCDGVDFSVDQKLAAVAGKEASDTGFFFGDPGQRDLGWYSDTRGEALKLAAKMRTSVNAPGLAIAVHRYPNES